MKKLFITNRKKQRIAVLTDISKNQKGLAVVMHGLGGYKEQLEIETIANVFKEEGFTAVRFDTTNTFGESYGKYEDATTTNYYEDMLDVIIWAKKQSWYEEPFWLCGHSLGGICVLLFAEEYPEMIKAIAPIAAVVSGKLSMKSPKYKENNQIEQWKKTGWRIEQSEHKHIEKKLPWSHMVDRQQYDALKKVDKLKMPVLMVVGENDDSTPLVHQKILYDKLAGEKELHIIKNAPHVLLEKEHIIQIKDIFRKWIRNVMIIEDKKVCVQLICKVLQ
ncbi:alpha/beta fold hydrolase [Candidatus Woesearchaeota archaeon]|nr:alpha/beta fold hydrolase [Candidatus Woesearchaeota archaeon]